MHTSTPQQPLDGTPANSKRKAVLRGDPIVRNVRSKWDRKKNALAHLSEAEMDEDRIRPFLKEASTLVVAQMNLESGTKQGPDLKALLDSIISKTELLRKAQQSSGILDTLPLDEAKSIPLIFDNLMRFCDHAKRSTGGPKHNKEVEDLRKELHKLSKQRSSDANRIGDLQNERDALRTERDELLRREQSRPQDNYHSLYLLEFGRARELSKDVTQLQKDCKRLQSENGDLRSSYHNERQKAVAATEKCRQLHDNEAKTDAMYAAGCKKLCLEAAAIKRLEEELKAHKGKIEELHEQQEQKLADAEAVANMEKEILENRITALDGARNAATTRSNELQIELDALKESHAQALISEKAAANQELLKLRKSNQKRYDDHAVYVKKRHDDKLIHLQRDAATSKKNDRLEVERKQEQIESLERAKGDFEGQITGLKADHRVQLEKTKGDIRDLKKNQTDMKRQAIESKNEHSRKLEEKQTQILRLEQEFNSCKEQVCKSEGVHQLEVDLKQDQILRLEQEKDTFKGQIIKMKEEHRLELKNNQDQILRLQRDANGYNLDITSLKVEHHHQIEQKQRHIQDLEDKNDGLIKEKSVVIRELQGQLVTEQSQIQVLEQAMLVSNKEQTSKIEDLQTQLRKARSSREEQQILVKELSETMAKKEESMEKVETRMAVYERERQFQLSRLNTSTLFGEFSNHARNMLNGRSFSGNIKGQPANVCICVLLATEEVLIVIHKGECDAYMVWQSRMEDCTTFEYRWQFWLRLGGRFQREPLYISMDTDDKVRAWSGPLLSSWVLSTEERLLVGSS